MANAWYNQGKTKLMDGTYDYLTSTIKALLVNSGYTFNKDHDVIDPGTNDAADISFNELSGTGYVRKTLGTKTVTVDDTNDFAKLSAANITWTAINAGTAAAMIVFIDTGSDATAVPLLYIDSAGFPKATNGSDLQATINANGLARF